jgi:hypothetical protein
MAYEPSLLQNPALIAAALADSLPARTRWANAVRCRNGHAARLIKCLAQSNKSCTGGKATNRSDAPLLI